MRGRARELDLVERSLRRALDGVPTNVVLTGARGSGKTSMLQEARARASRAGMRVLTTQGRRGDVDLAFSGLLTLLRPVERDLSELAGEWAADLLAALSLGRHAADPIGVQLGLFRVLTHLAETTPVCLVMDDVDLVDRASVDALGFALGRLAADPIVAFGACAGATPWPDAVVVELGALDTATIEAILRDRAGSAETPNASYTVSGDVVASYARLAGGNPGCAIEFLAALTDGQRRGTEHLPPVPRPSEAIVQRLRSLLDGVDEPTRRALVVVAADDTGDAVAVRRALLRLGEAPDALEQAESRGLVSIVDTSIRFVEPMLRPVAYHLVAPASRRAAHRALAEAFDRPEQAGERAWQLAAACDRPDDAVAEAIALVAQSATRRGGPSSAARILERAASLAASPERARHYQLAAAAQWYEALEFEAARRILVEMGASSADEVAALAEVIDAAEGPAATAAALAATGIDLDATPSGDLADPASATGWLARRRARRQLETDARSGRHRAVFDAVARAGGHPGTHAGTVPELLAVAAAHRHAGSLDQARAEATLAEAMAARRGPLLSARVAVVVADLDVLAGRPTDALERLEPAIDVLVAAGADDEVRDARRIRHRAIAASSGTAVTLDDVAPDLEPVAGDAGPLAEVRHAAAAGARALDPDALARAASLADAHELPVEAAEIRLTLAEVLHAAGDVDGATFAAEQARDALLRLGVRAWAARLAQLQQWQGTPAAAPVASVATDGLSGQLTAAEFRVAEATASGLTNREVAAALFLSVKTVDFHLRSIYRKLGLRSRTELALLMARGASEQRGRHD